MSFIAATWTIAVPCPPSWIVAIEVFINIVMILEVLLNIYIVGIPNFIRSASNLIDLCIVGVCILTLHMLLAGCSKHTMEKFGDSVLLIFRNCIQLVRLLLLWRRQRTRARQTESRVDFSTLADLVDFDEEEEELEMDNLDTEKSILDDGILKRHGSSLSLASSRSTSSSHSISSPNV